MSANNPIPILLKAMVFAAEKHRLQRRKDEETPYINHPLKVAEILADAGETDTDLLVAAILHDTVEDPARLHFAAPLAALLKPENAEQIDEWIAGLNSEKHERKQSVDWVSFLAMLANHLARVFSRKPLGVFEGVVAKRFHSGSYTGIFRVLHGPSQTFIDVLDYEGSHSFSDELVYLVDPAAGRALLLSPLYFWGLLRDPSDPNSVDMYEYDNNKRDRFGFRSTQLAEGLTIDTGGD